MPAEQEQSVIKCKHCPKFFLSRPYLQKHYSRHHPQSDFLKDFPLTDSDPIQEAQHAMETTVNEKLERFQKQFEAEKLIK